jgi:hypothetical protein
LRRNWSRIAPMTPARVGLEVPAGWHAAGKDRQQRFDQLPFGIGHAGGVAGFAHQGVGPGLRDAIRDRGTMYRMTTNRKVHAA